MTWVHVVDNQYMNIIISLVLYNNYSAYVCLIYSYIETSLIANFYYMNISLVTKCVLNNQGEAVMNYGHDAVKTIDYA